MLSRVSFFISPKCKRSPITRDIKIREIKGHYRSNFAQCLYILYISLISLDN